MSEYKLSPDRIQNILITFLDFLEQVIDYEHGDVSRTIKGKYLKLTIDIHPEIRGANHLGYAQSGEVEIMEGELTVNELPEGVKPEMVQAYNQNITIRDNKDTSRVTKESDKISINDAFNIVRKEKCKYCGKNAVPLTKEDLCGQCLFIWTGDTVYIREEFKKYLDAHAFGCGLDRGTIEFCTRALESIIRRENK